MPQKRRSKKEKKKRNKKFPYRQGGRKRTLELKEKEKDNKKDSKGKKSKK